LLYLCILKYSHKTIIEKEKGNQMRKQTLSMQALISNNKKEILLDEKELERIEKQIDEKHMKELEKSR
jgi:hypothetical protein